MAIKFNNTNTSSVKFTGKDTNNNDVINADVKSVKLNDSYVWCKPFILTTIESTATASIIRVSTNEPSASTGTLHNGDKIYYGDIITVSASPKSGYHNASYICDAEATGTANRWKVVGDTHITASALRNTWNAKVITKDSSYYLTNGKIALSNNVYVAVKLRVTSMSGQVTEHNVSYNQTFTLSNLDWDDVVEVIHNEFLYNEYGYWFSESDHPQALPYYNEFFQTSLLARNTSTKLTRPSSHGGTSVGEVDVGGPTNEATDRNAKNVFGLDAGNNVKWRYMQCLVYNRPYVNGVFQDNDSWFNRETGPYTDTNTLSFIITPNTTSNWTPFNFNIWWRWYIDIYQTFE